jgi:hypothetical protein
MIKNISIGGKSFRTQAETCNIVFGCTYKGLQKGCFIPRVLRNAYGDKYHVWFPYLDEASDSYWENKLNQNGTEITETHPKIAEVKKVYAEQKDWTFVTFAKKNRGYEFIGVFRIKGITGNTISFERISTSFP